MTSNQGGTGGTATATLNVVPSGSPPSVTKAFAPSNVAVNGVSTLTLTFTNPAGNPGPLTGISLTDPFPAGLVVGPTPGAVNSCGGTFAPAAGATSISLTGGAIANPGASCAISVQVRATTAGPKVNTTQAVTAAETGPGGTATATLTAGLLPALAASFTPSEIAVGGNSVLRFTITNQDAAQSRSNIGFSNTFPPGLAVAATPGATNTCGGTFTATAGASSLSLSGATLAAGANCALEVSVTGGSAGAKVTTGPISSTESGPGGTATATLNVSGPPTVTQAFAPANVPVNGTSTLTITLTNPAANPGGVTDIGVSETFPAGLAVAATPGATNTCGGTFSPVAGATSISLSGGSIAAAGGSCAVSVQVRATTQGNKVNTTAAVTSAEGGTGSTATATLIMDSTPPVALLSFDRATHALVALARDGDAGAPTMAAVLRGTIATTWDAPLVGPEQVDAALLSAAAELRTYVATDDAGNTLTIQVKVRANGAALQAFVVTTSGNDGTPMAAGPNLLQASWWVDRSGVETVTVWVTVGAVGADQQQVEGKFSSATTQTAQTTFTPVANRTVWTLERGASVTVNGYAPPRLVAADGARFTIER